VKPPLLLKKLAFVKKPECIGAAKYSEFVEILLTSFKELDCRKEGFVNKPDDTREFCDGEFSKHIFVTLRFNIGFTKAGFGIEYTGLLSDFELYKTGFGRGTPLLKSGLLA
jgi:hypothetical protein